MRAEAHVHIGRARRGLADCVSLRNLPDGRTEHTGTVVFSKPRFSVQPAGLYLFRSTGRKNVHAFVRGEVEATVPNLLPFRAGNGWFEVKYNPARHDTFVFVMDGKEYPISQAHRAVLSGTKCYAYLGS